MVGWVGVGFDLRGVVPSELRVGTVGWVGSRRGKGVTILMGGKGGLTELQGRGDALGWEGGDLTALIQPNWNHSAVPREELITPGLKKSHPPAPHEAANTAVIAGRGCPPPPVLPIHSMGLNSSPLLSSHQWSSRWCSSPC